MKEARKNYQRFGLLLALALISGLSAAWSPLANTAEAEDMQGEDGSIIVSVEQTPYVNPTGAGTDPWTTVGSAGTVDEADTNVVDLNGALAQVKPGGQASAVVDIRYNVVSEGGIYGGDGYLLTARFRDNGTFSRVILYLKEYNLLTGTTTTRMTLDSNAFPASNSYQTQSVGVCSPAWSFDFFNKAYFIEAQIQKTKNNTNYPPGLGGLKIGYNLC